MKKSKAFILFIRRMWKLDKLYVLVVLFQKLIITFRTLLTIFIPKLLLDLILSEASMDTLLQRLAFVIGLTFLAYFLESLLNRSASIELEKINVKLEQTFSEKMMSLPYRYLEDPKYLEMKEEARMGINMGSLVTILNHLSIALEKTFIIIGLSALLYNLNPLIFLGTCVLQLFVWVLLQRKTILFRKTVEGIIPINRKYNYFIMSMLDTPAQKDIRLYDMSEMLTENVLHYNELMLRDFIRMDWKDGIYSSFAHFINYLVSSIVIFYSGSKVIEKTMSLGNFTLFTSAAINFSLSVREGLSAVLQIMNSIHFIEPIEAFLGLPNDQENQRGISFDEELQSIEVRDVWFQYPGSEEWILKNLSFSISKGEKISIVGLNGAGKSTLVKLIARFFPATKGKILMNGRDINDYEYTSYMKKISAVFQDFQILNFSIAENILGECKEDPKEREKAMELLRDLGLEEKVDSLSKGIDTYLGKSFREDGIEVSGGQLQKIAIARALYKNADLVILDEPTSALDPLAEAEIYEHFNRLVGNKTAIYISHRMSSSVFCDKILLINQGTKEDFDSHKELMKKKDSLYYKLFQTQAQHFKV